MPNLNVLLNMTHQILETAATNLRGSAQTVGGALNSTLVAGVWGEVCSNGLSLFLFLEDDSAVGVGLAQTAIEPCVGVINNVCTSYYPPQYNDLCYTNCGEDLACASVTLFYNLGANNALLDCVAKQITAAFCPSVPLEKNPWIISLEVVAGVTMLFVLGFTVLSLQKRYCQPKPPRVFFSTSADTGETTSDNTRLPGERRPLLGPGR